MKKKILLVSLSDNADHQEAVWSMYRSLCEEREVHLLMLQHPKVQIQPSEHLHLIDAPLRPGLSLHALRILPLLRMIKQLRKERFDVVYFESLHLWNVLLIHLLKPAKCYYAIHDIEPHAGERSSRNVARFTHYLVHQVDVAVVRSRMFVRTLAERYQLAEQYIRYCRLWRMIPEQPSVPQASGVMLLFGRINPYKGLDKLREIALLSPEVSFHLMGKVDARVEQSLQALRELPNVQIQTGYIDQDDLRKHIAASYFVILPYSSATQSGVIVEAYKQGRPVIAFDTGAISEQVLPNETGFLVPELDSEAFAATLRQALALPPERYETMCRAAHSFARTHYHVDAVKSEFLSLIDED